MSATRTPIRILLTLLIAIGIIGSTALLARAYEPVEFTHKPGEATFHNPNDVAAEINYGTANSGDVRHVTVPPGETVSVVAADPNFGYTISINGEEVQHLEWPGVDLSAAKYEQQNAVTVKVGEGYIEFTNDNPWAAEVWFGSVNTDQSEKVDIPANDSVRVPIKNVGRIIWTADVGQVPAGGNMGTEGLDLTQYEGKKPETKPTRPSLPSTGN